MIREKQLDYVGSIVLGLNDALVELTGALAGLTLALQNTRLIAIAGLITAIAASFSMAASEYLSNKSDGWHIPGIAPAVVQLGDLLAFLGGDDAVVVFKGLVNSPLQ